MKNKKMKYRITNSDNDTLATTDNPIHAETLKKYYTNKSLRPELEQVEIITYTDEERKERIENIRKEHILINYYTS